MIIEFHLTRLEDTEIGDHLKRCDTAFCEDIAHLYAALVEDYADRAQVSTLVDGEEWRRQKELFGRAESGGSATEADRPASLAIIRRAWDRLEVRDREERPAQD